ncbi:MAG: DUF5696 domain-containing protein [Armatimonadota bacterium]
MNVRDIMFSSIKKTWHVASIRLTALCAHGSESAIAGENQQIGNTKLLRARIQKMSITLDPEKCSIEINDGYAVWMLAGSKSEFARVAMPALKAEYAVGGPGNIAVEWKSDGKTIYGVGKLPNAQVSFRMTYELLSGCRLKCRIDFNGADTTKITDVTFPAAPKLTGVTSRLVVPQWLGLLVSPEGQDINVRRSVWLRPWCMRFVGATQHTALGERSYIAIVNDSLHRSIDIWRKNNELGFSYVGDQAYVEKSAAKRSQTLEFEFLDGDYVAIAKRYRKFARQLPTWRTLATRMRPCDEKVVGGAILFAHVPCDYGEGTTSFDTFIPRIKALKDAGIERAMFHIGGWNRKGYDSQYPDILSANPNCGGDDGMRRLTKAIDDLGYLCLPHDDVGILSMAAPSYDDKWIARWSDGSKINGGVYRDQQYHMSSGAAQAHFAERNMPEVHKRFPDVHGWLYDVTTSTQPLEDYSTNPPTPKNEDIRNRTLAFKSARDALASFTLGESIVDWSIEYNDGGFMAEEGYYHRGEGGWCQDKLYGEIVPMWELIYHDSHIGFRESSIHVNTPMETDDPLIRYLRIYLKTLRAGTVPPCIYSDKLTNNIIGGYIEQSKKDFGGWSKLNNMELLAAVSRVSTWLADNVFYDEMIDHDFVEGNLYHEKAVFKGKNGNSVIYVNTGLKPWSPIPGVMLAPLGFYISGPKLLAYHATEVGGIKLMEPTLAVFKGEFRKNSKVSAYRAFGDTKLLVPSGHKNLTVVLSEANRTTDVTIH